MKSLLVTAVAFATLAVAATASGGGWATVGVSPASPPDEAGAIWNVKLNIKQHGRTPLENVSPSIIISNDDGDTRTFAATPTGEPGIYAAEVRFPTAGTWSYRIDDGFSQVHTYKPVQIVGDGGGSSFPTVPVTFGVLIAALGGAALVFLARRRHLGGAPAPAGQ